MNKRHLKRFGMPKSWPTKRKGVKFVTKPKPGPHKQVECVTLNVILKDILKIAKTAREVKKILDKKAILVDDIIRTDPRFPLGVMDTLSIPLLNQYYRLILNKKGKFELLPITKQESQEKFCKVVNKTLLKKNKLQLNLYDAKNVSVDKDSYKVGDSVIISNNKIKKHLKLGKDALIYIMGGKHVGRIGRLEEIKKHLGITKDTIIINIDKKKIETLKDYAFVIENESNARNKA